MEQHADIATTAESLPESGSESAVLSDADSSALRKYFGVEIAAQNAGCINRELGEDIRDTRNQIIVAERRIEDLSTTHDARLEIPQSQLLDQQYLVEQLRIRLAVLEPANAAAQERANSLRATRDSLRKHPSIAAILDRNGITY